MLTLLQVRIGINLAQRIFNKANELSAAHLREVEEAAKAVKVATTKGAPKAVEAAYARLVSLQAQTSKFTTTNLIRVLLSRPLPPDAELLEGVRADGVVRGRPAGSKRAA